MIGDPNPLFLGFGVMLMGLAIFLLLFAIGGGPTALVVAGGSFGYGLTLIVFAHLSEPYLTARFGYEQATAVQMLVFLTTFFALMYCLGHRYANGRAVRREAMR